MDRDLAPAREGVERLVETFSRTTGPAADAVRAELERAQANVSTLDARLAEVRAREAALATQHVDEADVARALQDFDELWSRAADAREGTRPRPADRARDLRRRDRTAGHHLLARRVASSPARSAVRKVAATSRTWSQFQPARVAAVGTRGPHPPRRPAVGVGVAHRRDDSRRGRSRTSRPLPPVWGDPGADDADHEPRSCSRRRFRRRSSACRRSSHGRDKVTERHLRRIVAEPVWHPSAPTLEERMPHLAPPTLTADEQRLILRATAGNPRDHLIFCFALGTGLRLAEIVGLNVGDVFAPNGTPRVRVTVRAEIAKGRRAADVFLPDRARREVEAVLGVQGEARRGTGTRRPAVLQPVPEADLETAGPVRVARLAAEGGVRPAVPVPRHPPLGGHQRVSRVAGPVPGAEVRPPRLPADDRDLHASVGPGVGESHSQIVLLIAIAPVAPLPRSPDSRYN